MRVAQRAAAAAALLAAAGLLVLSCAWNVDLPPRYAIVYGISNYNGSTQDLQYPDDDAIALAAALGARGWTVVQRTAVTAAQMTSDFAAASASLPADGIFLFYFSGHGGQYISAGEEPSSAADARDEFIFLSNGTTDFALSDNAIRGVLAAVSARGLMVVIDACNSGGFIGDSFGVDMIPSEYGGSLGGAPFADLGEALQAYFGTPSSSDLAAGGVLVMAAAGERELSWESSSYGHGIFTYFLLQAAERGDANRDGHVTVTEAYDYTRRAIEEVWNTGETTQTSRDFYYFLPHISGGPVDYVLY